MPGECYVLSSSPPPPRAKHLACRDALRPMDKRRGCRRQVHSGECRVGALCKLQYGHLLGWKLYGQDPTVRVGEAVGRLARHLPNLETVRTNDAMRQPAFQAAGPERRAREAAAKRARLAHRGALGQTSGQTAAPGGVSECDANADAGANRVEPIAEYEWCLRAAAASGLPGVAAGAARKATDERKIRSPKRCRGEGAHHPLNEMRESQTRGRPPFLFVFPCGVKATGGDVRALAGDASARDFPVVCDARYRLPSRRSELDVSAPAAAAAAAAPLASGVLVNSPAGIGALLLRGRGARALSAERFPLVAVRKHRDRPRPCPLH
ncbi:hypothetical protein HPB51_018484 [Rhipicephalus microplus]|uniref:Uncharacterized protein n=1 Tax=Rhipicephalus microplus TaxID=6941 RepID=A0A9J6DBB8_RHIMP|nr:hypothetical protein HPB51_018484 [Rhipicephalus microplus]